MAIIKLCPFLGHQGAETAYYSASCKKLRRKIESRLPPTGVWSSTISLFAHEKVSILNDCHILILRALLLCPPHSYIVSNLTPLQVDFVSYMDDLAGEIGVRPSLPWLFFTDYPLFQQVLWGPVTAYQYRLMGPGKWDGARRAIFTQFDRMNQALKTRKVQNKLLTPIPHSKIIACCKSGFTIDSQFSCKSVSTRWRRNGRPQPAACWSGAWFSRLELPPSTTSMCATRTQSPTSCPKSTRWQSQHRLSKFGKGNNGGRLWRSLMSTVTDPLRC